MLYLLEFHNKKYIPFNLFLNCLEYLFKIKKFKYKRIDKIEKKLENDIVIFFAPETRNRIKDINCDCICIQTEKDINLSLYKNIRIIAFWDYTYKNISKKYYKNINYVPFLYSKNLELETEKNTKHDIIFFGLENERRIKIINRIKEEKINFFYGHNYFNVEGHFKLIKETKVVLVIHYYLEDFPIDYYRITPLICNKIFIIHEEVQKEDMETEEYRILSETIPFVKHENMVEECQKWLSVPQEERDKITEKTYQNFKEKMSLEKYIPWEQLKNYE